MCFKTPQVVQRNPEAEAATAAAEAQAKANALTIATRSRRRATALETGAGNTALGPATPSPVKQTLGA